MEATQPDHAGYLHYVVRSMGPSLAPHRDAAGQLGEALLELLALIVPTWSPSIWALIWLIRPSMPTFLPAMAEKESVGNQVRPGLQPGKSYPNTTELAGFMEVNDTPAEGR